MNPNLNFLGATLYNKEAIGVALKSYRAEVTRVEDLLDAEYERANFEYQKTLTWFDKVLGHRNLNQKFVGGWFISVYQELFEEGYMKLSEDDITKVSNLSAYSFPNSLGVWEFEAEYFQVKALFGGDRDCYLNPRQAAFVNKWKNFLDT
ncbi:hypothetical protein KUA24_156 [Vibrio phage HNL01]|nr:hypothetical protein KUA24_156 [Vibrio phage HNL01]